MEYSEQIPDKFTINDLFNKIINNSIKNYENT